MEGAVFAQPGKIEPILKLLRTKLAQYQAKHAQDRAAQIPLLTAESPDGLQAIFSRGAGPEDGRFPPRSSSRCADGDVAGKGNVVGVNKVLDYQGNENDAGNYEINNNGFIQSFHNGAAAGATANKIGNKGGAGAVAGLAAEVEDLKALNQVLEVKAAKLEQLLRLKDAKIAALTARLHGAGLLTSPAPQAQPAAARGVGVGV